MESQISEKNELDTVSKLNVIFSQNKLQELPYDSKIKNVLRIIFNNNEKINHEIIPKNKILIPFIDLVYTLFKLKKKDRKKLYDVEICLIRNEEIKKNIEKLNDCQSIFIDKENEKLYDLYDIISNSFSTKRYCLYTFINWSIWNLSFSFQSNNLLNFQIFSLIITKYDLKIEYSENEIDVSNDICLDLVIDLLDAKKEGKDSIIISLLLIKYGSFKNIIKEYGKLNNMLSKLINDPNIININDIIQLSCEEIKKIDINKGDKINKRDEIDLKGSNENIKAVNYNNFLCIQHNPSKDCLNNENNNINNNIQFWDKKNEYINIINNLFTNINMKELNKDELNKQLNEIKALLYNLVNCNSKQKDDNEKLKDKMAIITDNLSNISNDNKAMKKEISNLLNENSVLNAKISNIYNDNEKMSNDNKAMKKEISNLLNENSVLNAKISNIYNDNKRILNNNEKMSNDNKAMKKKMSNLLNENSVLNEKITNIYNDNLCLNLKLDKLNDKIDKITNFLDCPISLERMTDPVITPDGNTFENANIRDWINNHNNTDPLSQNTLDEQKLIKNIALKNIICIVNEK